MEPRLRYDKIEDRMNDIKRHDNPNHPSYHAHQKRLLSAEEELRYGLEEYYGEQNNNLDGQYYDEP